MRTGCTVETEKKHIKPQCSKEGLSPGFNRFVYVAMEFSSSRKEGFILLITVLIVRISRTVNESKRGTLKIAPFWHVGLGTYLLHTSHTEKNCD
jgi:hypothetical protein